MATPRSNEAICRLVHDRTLELESKGNHFPIYRDLVITADMLIVIEYNERKLQIHSLRNGKLLATSHRLESGPMGICLISRTEVGVILEKSAIEILSFRSLDDIKLVKRLNVTTGFNRCDAVAKINTDKLVVSGWKLGMGMCWCVVSISDGRVDSVHKICKEDSVSHLAIKDDTVYISLNGVYAYDIFNPYTWKFLYQHCDLENPRGIIVDSRGFIFVCNMYSDYSIHQLTDSGQLVTIHRLSSWLPQSLFYDDRHGILYTTSFQSNKITVYRMEYLHQSGVPSEILNMDDRSIQLFEEALRDGKETVYSIRVMVVGHVGVGKTTLIKRLLGETVNISERHSTEGIDVYVNCCDVSLLTHEWTRRIKGSEEDYNLQRLVKVLTENYQTSDSSADQKQVASSPQRERTDHNPIGIFDDCDENTEVLYHCSPQQNLGQNHSSRASLQEEFPSTVDESNLTQPENYMMPGRESGGSIAAKSHKADPLWEMLKLLKENPDRAEQDVTKYARLTIWDFAGQYAFYTTHQMFLTRRAIYLLVSDVSGQITDVVEDECYFDTDGKMKCKVHELVEIWLNSIHSCAPSDKEIMNSAYSPASSYTVIPPPVILVGTHIDIITQRQLSISAIEEWKQPQILHAEMVTSTTTSKPTHSREQPTLSISQETLQTSSAVLQRKRRATEQVFSCSIQKGVTCADPKLLYQVLHNSTQGAFSSRYTLERNCQTVGLKFHGETPGNGNCFFEAVSSQLQRLNCPVQISPQQLRQDIVAFLKANQVLQVSAGIINFAEFMCNESFEEYCARMAKDGEWADHVMVVAMARKLQRDVMIITSSPSSGSDDIIAWVVGQDSFQGDPVLLGHIWEHHYESLEPIDSPDLKIKCWRQAVEKKRFDENNTKNQVSMIGNYGGHFVVPSFPRNPMQHDAEDSSSLDTEDSSSLDTEDSLDAESSIDGEDRMEYCRELGQRYLRKIRSYLSDKPTIVHLVDEDFAIDNTVVDSKLEELKRKIVEVASQQPYWGEEIPTRWFLLEQQLMRLRDAGVKVISLSTVEELNKEGTVQIKESEELDLFLKYLHETGTIIYFSIEVLRDNIVLDPIWLIDALKSLINAQPNLRETSAYSDSRSNSTTDRYVTQKWLDFKEKGILTLELVDAIWTKEKHPQLHAYKDHILLIMEQFNIIAMPRSFSEIGEKMENYFLTPCMLRQESPREVIYPEQDPRMVITPVLCCVFRGKYLPPPIFHRLIAACISRWPVAKKKETSENLIFCGCCVFDLDLFHRLTLYCKNYIVFARITRMVIDEVDTPSAKLCNRVRKFITLNLSKITSYLGQNLQFELRVQYPLCQYVSEDGMVGFSPPFEMWFADEGHDPDIPLTPEHMNHARLCVALTTVCGNAMREILRTQVPAPHTNIYQALLANKVKLTRRMGRPLLRPDQMQLVFPDSLGKKTGTLDQFELSLLYTLIRNVSSVSAPKTGWGNDPLDQPRDTSLGASVERIRSYRNHISGHSPDGTISRQYYEDYWNKFEAVIHDIEAIIGGQEYSQELEKQKKQVISIYEAC